MHLRRIWTGSDLGQAGSYKTGFGPRWGTNHEPVCLPDGL